MTSSHRHLHHDMRSVQAPEYAPPAPHPAPPDNDTVEQTSGLGKAMAYLNKHVDGLTAFCRVPGAQLDNNKMENQLKLMIRDRKNAMFRKTQTGANIGDVATSLIATFAEAGINVFDYFIHIQRKHENVKSNPADYLPWNYKPPQPD